MEDNAVRTLPVSRLRRALIKDFDALYVRQFDAHWRSHRIIRSTEISIMALDHLQDVITDLIHSIFQPPAPKTKLDDLLDQVGISETGRPRVQAEIEALLQATRTSARAEFAAELKREDDIYYREDSCGHDELIEYELHPNRALEAATSRPQSNGEVCGQCDGSGFYFIDVCPKCLGTGYINLTPPPAGGHTDER